MAEENDGGLGGFGGLFKVYQASKAIDTAKDEDAKLKATQQFVKMFHELKDTNKIFALLFVALFMPHKGANLDLMKLVTAPDELEKELLPAAIADKSKGKLTRAEATVIYEGAINPEPAPAQNNPAPQVAANVQAGAGAGAQASLTIKKPDGTTYTFAGSAEATAAFQAAINVSPKNQNKAVSAAPTSTLPQTTANKPGATTQAEASSVPEGEEKSNEDSQTQATATEQVTTDKSSPEAITQSANVVEAKLDNEDLIKDAEQILDPTGKGLSLNLPKDSKLIPFRDALVAKVTKMYDDIKPWMTDPTLIKWEGAKALTLKKITSLELTHDELHAILTDPKQVALLKKVAGSDGKLTEDELLNADVEKEFVAAIPPVKLAKKIDDNLRSKLHVGSGLKTS